MDRHKKQEELRQLAIDQWQNRCQQGKSMRPAEGKQAELEPKGKKKDEDKDREAGVGR